MPTNDLPAAFSGSRSMALGRALRRGHVGLQLSPQEVVGVPRRPKIARRAPGPTVGHARTTRARSSKSCGNSVADALPLFAPD